ncbi:MAG: putative porin [Bacteroidota bacterium]|jgi:hypothetical protein
MRFLPIIFLFYSASSFAQSSLLHQRNPLDSSLLSLGNYQGINTNLLPSLQTGAILSSTSFLHPLAFEYSGFAPLPNLWSHLASLPSDHPPLLKKAFSNLSFGIGSRREQIFSLYHLQQFANRLIIEANITGMRGDGFYRNQTSRFSQVTSKISYSNLNNTYHSSVSLNFLSHLQRLNGGVPDTILYPPNYPSFLYEVNIPQAFTKSTANSITWQNSLQIMSFGDSARPFRIYLLHHSEFGEYLRTYGDSLQGILKPFPENRFDTVSSSDFAFQQQIVNDLACQFITSKHQLKLGLSLPMNYQSNLLFGNHFTSFLYHAKYDYFNGKYTFHAGAGYYDQGWNNRDYFTEISTSANFNKLVLRAEFKNIRVAAPLYYSRYASNHFTYVHTFNPQLMRHAIVKASMPFLNLEAGASVIQNLVLPDSINFSQLNESQIFFWSMLETSVNNKKFEWNARMLFQQVNGSLSKQIPSLFIHASAGYKFSLFSKHLSVLAGAAISYTSAYSGWSFSPALGVFALSSNNSLLQAYPLSSIFLNFKASSLSWYVRGDNMLYPYFRTAWYSVDAQPMQNFVFRFGIRWHFFDGPFSKK